MPDRELHILNGGTRRDAIGIEKTDNSEKKGRNPRPIFVFSASHLQVLLQKISHLHRKLFFKAYQSLTDVL